MPSLPEALRPLLSASRALLGETLLGLGNPPWEEASARVLIVRLSPFRDVDRSSSHLILFGETRAALPGAFLDFAFLPERRDRELLDAAGREGGSPLPWFFGVASGASPADFDLVMVSNAFGLELLNLPYLLSSAGLPLRASARRAERARRADRARDALRSEEAASLPIVILGGSNAAQAGALVDEAGDSLVDGLFFGEGEGAIGELAALLCQGAGRAEERLSAAAEGIEGFWPALHPGLRVRRKSLPTSPPPLLSWPLFNGEEAGTARLQITAGCPGLCSFCFEGWDRRPYRELPLAQILEAARELRRRTGAESLEVYSFNFNTHEEVVALLFELGRVFRRVNFMSQRLDILAKTEGLLDAELAADKRSFTLGVEGISQALRAYYRKGLAEEELGRLLRRLVAPGIRELKLFYILSGLETEADLKEFSGFAREFGALRSARAPGLRILVSAGYLVRLPGTPLRHAPLLLEEKAFRRIAASMEKDCEDNGLEFRLAVHFDEYCADQVLALRGGALLPWLEALPAEGHCYEGSLSRLAWPSLRDFADSRGLLGPDFLGEKGPDWPFPLAFLDSGRGGPAAQAEVLHREYIAARRGRDRKPCLGADCSGCGACEDGEEIGRMTGHRIRSATRADFVRITRLMAAKAAFSALPVLATLPESLAGASPEAVSAWLLRRLSKSSPGAESRVFEARPLLPGKEGPFGLEAGSIGLALFLLYGPKPEAAADDARLAGLEPLEAAPDFRRALVELAFPATFAESAAYLAKAGAEGRAEPRRPEDLLKAWLAEERISFVEEAAEGGRSLLVAPRDRRKGILLSARTAPEGLRLELGPNANLAQLLGRLGPQLARLVLVRVLELD